MVGGPLGAVAGAAGGAALKGASDCTKYACDIAKFQTGAMSLWSESKIFEDVRLRIGGEQLFEAGSKHHDAGIVSIKNHRGDDGGIVGKCSNP